MAALARPAALSFFVVALSSLIPSAALGDPLPSVNLRAFAPSTSPDATLFLEPANVQAAFHTNSSAWLSWAYRPLVIRRDGEIVGKLVSQQTSLDAGFGLGLGRRAEVGVLVPVVLAQGSDDNDATRQALEGGTISSHALGDVLLSGKVNLAKVDELGGFGLAAIGRVSLPTGDRASAVGEGALTSELRLLAEYRLIATGFRATAGFKLRPEDRVFAGKTWGDEIPWGASFYLKPQMFGLDEKGRWMWSLEAHGSLPAGPDAPFSSAAQATAFLGATARYKIRDLSLLGGLESGLTQGAGSAPVRIVAQIAWAPREHDRDHDGIEDEKDECPDLAEDKDGFQDEDGCPEGDNDDDNVPDTDDKCPLEPEDEDDFQDEDGCPDPDNDQDGILDKDDACPNEAGPASSDRKKNGCPDKDKDKDGIPDADDQCPDQPEDKDGFEDDDGCPDPDNDGDGVADADDACPNQKGEPSATPSLNGCPSPDRDGDGIANDKDKCPDKAETYNGFEDDDGCPEPEDKRHKPLVTITEKKGQRSLAIATPVRFAGETAELTPESQATLRAVAQVLNAHPSWKVLISVRPGKKPGADELAKARAAAAVGAIQKATSRPSTALAQAWERGKVPASAEVSGVAVILVPGEGP